MKDKEKVFEVNGKKYKAIFNLNVMQEIQNEYGTFEEWGRLTEGYVYDEFGERKFKLDKDGNFITKKIKDENNNEMEINVFETKEPDIKALIFGIKAMINEAIDIENETLEVKKEFLTHKQVGRIISEMGITKATAISNEIVVDSIANENQKN